jgi:hypothetical protein
MSKYLKVTALGALLLFVGATASTSAWVDSSSRLSFVTFNGTVALPGVVLPAGSYIFELASPHADQELVRVSSRDRSKVYLTTFTTIVKRPAGLPADRIVTLGETARDGATPVKAWFPSRSADGFEFVYSR